MSAQALKVPEQPKFLRFTAPGESGEELSRVEPARSGTAEQGSGSPEESAADGTVAGDAAAAESDAAATRDGSAAQARRTGKGRRARGDRKAGRRR